MATFPSTIPSHIIAGHGFETKDQTVRSSMESGPDRVRRTSTAHNDTIPISWVFSNEQMAIFRDWFDSSIGANGGATWFTMTIDTGYGAIARDTRFKSGTLKASRIGFNTWSVASEVETR